MSMFKRIKNLLTPAAPAPEEKSILTLEAGDIIEASLMTHVVAGRVKNTNRNAIVLTLQDGNDLRYLHIEERETDCFYLYEPIDGRLDSIDEIPETIEMDDTLFHLEEQYNGPVTVSGKTPFSQHGEQYVWQFQSDDSKYLRIEWQDGRMMMYEGEKLLAGDVKIIRSSGK